MKSLKNIKGFSLIEMSVVVTIMAVVMGGTLAVSIKKKASAKISDTEEKIAFIIDAIDNYVDENGLVPCPADPELTFSAPAFGFSDCGNANFLTSVGATNIEAGAVPVYTLNIPPEYVFDAWNNRFSYVMDTDSYAAGTDHNITVRNLNMGSDFATDAVVMVISHGENGHGAWQGAGGATRVRVASIVDTTSEGENAHNQNDSSENSYDLNFTQSMRVSGFDDIVKYRTKWQLDFD